MVGATYGQGFLELSPKLTSDFGRVVEGQVSAASQRVSGFGDSLTKKLTLPLAAVGVAAFKMGSDLNESLSQVGQVFGDEAVGIISASESMGDAFSQDEFLGFAGNIGDIAQGLGIAKDESDDMAKGILSLSQDLSSFKDVPVEQAVSAITSALTGERESLKGLGIVLNDATVKQKALELGLYDGEGAIASAAQAQATLALITEKSSNAIGDFDRTSDSAANKTRTLTANFKDTAAQLGSNLLPIGQKLLDWANRLATWFSTLSPGAQKFVVILGGLAAAVGPVLSIGGRLVTNFGKVAGAFQKLSAVFAANPYLLLIAATVALVVLIVKNWDKIKEGIGKAWDALVGFFKGIPAAIVGFFKGAGQWLLNAGKAVLQGLWDGIVFVFGLVKFWYIDLPVKILGWIGDAGSWLFEKGKDIFEGLKAGLEAKAIEVKQYIEGLPGRILAALGDAKDWLIETGRNMLEGLWQGIQNAWQWLVDKIKEKLDFLPGFIKKFLGIASPSKMFATIGEQTMAGFRLGLESGWSDVEKMWQHRTLAGIQAVHQVGITASAGPVPLVAGSGGITVNGTFYGTPESMLRDMSIEMGRQVARRSV